MSFPGLRAEHLDNYREPRSRSNVYSRARLEIKEWLMGMSGPLLERLRAQGHEVAVLASDHHPSVWNRKEVDRQWIFFSRGSSERDSLERIVDHERSLASTLMDPTPYFKYSFMSVALSGDGFEASVNLNWRAWVDRDNFLVRMRDAGERERFLDLLSGLPEEYTIGLSGGERHRVTEVDGAMLGEILERYAREEGMLTVGLTVDPERTVELGEDLAEVASVAFLLLEPVYDVFTWSEDQDFISLSDREQAIDRERKAVADERRAEAEAYESRKRLRHREQKERFEEQRAQKMEDQKFLERMRRATVPAGPSRPSPEVERARGAPPPLSAGRDAGPARSDRDRGGRRARRRQETMRAIPFEVQPGMRVEIGSGVLEGKWGVVQQVDRHGRAKVVLGSLVARVPVDQLRPPRPGRWRS